MMKFAISYNTAYYGVDPDKIVAHAQHAEACGFEALYLPEHIVLYPGARVGRMRLLTVGVGTLPGEARAVGLPSAHVAAAPTRQSTCCGCCGLVAKTASASRWSHPATDPYRRVESGGRSSRRPAW